MNIKSLQMHNNTDENMKLYTNNKRMKVIKIKYKLNNKGPALLNE
jgi:hypothetical protein